MILECLGGRSGLRQRGAALRRVEHGRGVLAGVPAGDVCGKTPAGGRSLRPISLSGATPSSPPPLRVLTQRVYRAPPGHYAGVELPGGVSLLGVRRRT